MAYSSFRAGSGSYQQVRPITITPTVVPAFTTATESYSGADLANSSIADLTTDSQVLAQVTSTWPAGLLITAQAQISATGTLLMTYENVTNAPISPGAQQINLIVL